ncbi:hypothetical protein ILUMI_27003, partial [Ignelater luminosus]
MHYISHVVRRGACAGGSTPFVSCQCSARRRDARPSVCARPTIKQSATGAGLGHRT